jgi:hypothetical protein
MKIFVALVALLALVGSAMAWTLNDDLSYSCVKTGTQEAADNYILGADIGATSNAHFYDPAVAASDGTNVIPQSAATISNTLGDVAVARATFRGLPI